VRLRRADARTTYNRRLVVSGHNGGVRRLKRAAAAGAALLVPVALIAGCGASKHKGTTVPSGTTLTIYSSLPFSGPRRRDALDIRDAEQMALREHGDRVGKYTIRYISLDDASAKKKGWDPNATSANARTASQDQTTIAYLGDLDSGASAISIPVTNAVGILQVSPGSTAVGLTQGGPGADKGEPDKYYPTAMRTFGRVMPSDSVQGAVAARYMADKGCTELYILHDAELFDGDGLAEVVAATAPAAGIQVLGEDVIEPGATDLGKQAKEVRTSGADCVFFGSVAADRAGPAIEAIHAAVPGAKLFAPAQLATHAFVSSLSSGAQAVTYLTSPTLPPKLTPAAGRRFAAAFAAANHHAPSADAVFGYEAMQAVLASIRDAGKKGAQNQAVIKAFLALHDRQSALGTYSIDKRGDTTLTQFAGYRVRDGRLVFDEPLQPAA
jgi:branched-chain amino acid transport system substrate-binding protein